MHFLWMEEKLDATLDFVVQQIAIDWPAVFDRLGNLAEITNCELVFSSIWCCILLVLNCVYHLKNN